MVEKGQSARFNERPKTRVYIVYCDDCPKRQGKPFSVAKRFLNEGAAQDEMNAHRTVYGHSKLRFEPQQITRPPRDFMT